MSNMGRCGQHGCAFSVRLVNGQRDEYCPECEIDHLRTALATAQAERDEARAVLRDCNESHDRLKAERDSLRNKLTAMTAARNIEEDRANEADGQLAVLNAEMVALHTQLGAEDEETVLDAVLRLQRSHEDDTVLLGTVAAERDAALQRAEQAESALAQAQAERAPLVALLQECRQRVGDWIVGVGAMESNEDGFDLMHRIEAAVAQPPALPPLPTNWRHTGGPGGEMAGLITYQHIYTRVSVWPSGRVSVHDSSPMASADLITVLRHAEAAHQRLKEENRG